MRQAFALPTKGCAETHWRPRYSVAFCGHGIAVAFLPFLTIRRGMTTFVVIMGILGIHHVTSLASDPQRNLDFYTGFLGLRLVKQTVNFDAPDVYHLYYGDEVGRPAPFSRSSRSPTRRGGREEQVKHRPSPFPFPAGLSLRGPKSSRGRGSLSPARSHGWVSRSFHSKTPTA